MGYRGGYITRPVGAASSGSGNTLVSEQVLLATAQTLTVSGLTGNTHKGGYIIQWGILANGAVTAYGQPNGVTANTYLDRYAICTGGTVTDAQVDEQFCMCANNGDNIVAMGRLTFHSPVAVAGFPRQADAVMTTMNVATHVIVQTNAMTCMWSEGSTELTSFVISTVTANGFDIGSWIRAYAIG